MVTWLVSALLDLVANTIMTIMFGLIALMSDSIGVQATRGETFELLNAVFPLAAKMYPFFRTAGVGICLLICVYQLFKALFGPISQAESPVILVTRTAFNILVISLSPLICGILLQICFAPYQFFTSGTVLEEMWIQIGEGTGDKLTGNVSTSMGTAAANTGTAAASAILLMTGSGWILAFILIAAVVGLLKKFIALLIEMAERYVIMGFLTLIGPLCLATLASRSTSRIGKSWIQMMIAQSILMVFSVFFLATFAQGFGMWISSFDGFIETETSTVAANPFVVYLILIAWLQLATKVDTYMSGLGLSTAVAGDLAGAALGAFKSGEGAANGAVNMATGSTYGQKGSWANPLQQMMASRGVAAQMNRSMQKYGGAGNAARNLASSGGIAALAKATQQAFKDDKAQRAASGATGAKAVGAAVTSPFRVGKNMTNASEGDLNKFASDKSKMKTLMANANAGVRMDDNTLSNLMDNKAVKDKLNGAEVTGVKQNNANSYDGSPTSFDLAVNKDGKEGSVTLTPNANGDGFDVTGAKFENAQDAKDVLGEDFLKSPAGEDLLNQMKNENPIMEGGQKAFGEDGEDLVRGDDGKWHLQNEDGTMGEVYDGDVKFDNTSGFEGLADEEALKADSNGAASVGEIGGEEAYAYGLDADNNEIPLQMNEDGKLMNGDEEYNGDVLLKNDEGEALQLSDENGEVMASAENGELAFNGAPINNDDILKPMENDNDAEGAVGSIDGTNAFAYGVDENNNEIPLQMNEDGKLMNGDQEYSGAVTFKDKDENELQPSNADGAVTASAENGELSFGGANGAADKNDVLGPVVNDNNPDGAVGTINGQAAFAYGKDEGGNEIALQKGEDGKLMNGDQEYSGDVSFKDGAGKAIDLDSAAGRDGVTASAENGKLSFSSESKGLADVDPATDVDGNVRSDALKTVDGNAAYVAGVDAETGAAIPLSKNDNGELVNASTGELYTGQLQYTDRQGNVMTAHGDTGEVSMMAIGGKETSEAAQGAALNKTDSNGAGSVGKVGGVEAYAYGENNQPLTRDANNNLRTQDGQVYNGDVSFKDRNNNDINMSNGNGAVTAKSTNGQLSYSSGGQAADANSIVSSRTNDTKVGMNSSGQLEQVTGVSNGQSVGANNEPLKPMGSAAALAEQGKVNGVNDKGQVVQAAGYNGKDFTDVNGNTLTGAKASDQVVGINSETGQYVTGQMKNGKADFGSGVDASKVTNQQVATKTEADALKGNYAMGYNASAGEWQVATADNKDSLQNVMPVNEATAKSGSVNGYAATSAGRYEEVENRNGALVGKDTGNTYSAKDVSLSSTDLSGQNVSSANASISAGIAAAHNNEIQSSGGPFTTADAGGQQYQAFEKTTEDGKVSYTPVFQGKNGLEYADGTAVGNDAAIVTQVGEGAKAQQFAPVSRDAGASLVEGANGQYAMNVASVGKTYGSVQHTDDGAPYHNFRTNDAGGGTTATIDAATIHKTAEMVNQNPQQLSKDAAMYSTPAGGGYVQTASDGVYHQAALDENNQIQISGTGDNATVALTNGTSVPVSSLTQENDSVSTFNPISQGFADDNTSSNVKLAGTGVSNIGNGPTTGVAGQGGIRYTAACFGGDNNDGLGIPTHADSYMSVAESGNPDSIHAVTSMERYDREGHLDAQGAYMKDANNQQLFAFDANANGQPNFTQSQELVIDTGVQGTVERVGTTNLSEATGCMQGDRYAAITDHDNRYEQYNDNGEVKYRPSADGPFVKGRFEGDSTDSYIPSEGMVRDRNSYNNIELGADNNIHIPAGASISRSSVDDSITINSGNKEWTIRPQNTYGSESVGMVLPGQELISCKDNTYNIGLNNLANAGTSNYDISQITSGTLISKTSNSQYLEKVAACYNTESIHPGSALVAAQITPERANFKFADGYSYSASKAGVGDQVAGKSTNRMFSGDRATAGIIQFGGGEMSGTIGATDLDRQIKVQGVKNAETAARIPNTDKQSSGGSKGGSNRGGSNRGGNNRGGRGNGNNGGNGRRGGKK